MLRIPRPTRFVSRSVSVYQRSLSAEAALAATFGSSPPVSHPAFDVVSSKNLMEDLGDVEATLYCHRATGAEVLSMRSADTNKVFGVTFMTPPDSSDGVAHILEHSVLCGGRKYPLKEPFVELLKGSMHTFLNAFTYADRTCYPVASTNLKDFYNLIDVYLDAVFFPKITPLTFSQEGWHYAVGDAGDTLRDTASAKPELGYKGVVFNEMKGVYSQPDSLIHRHMSSALFSDPDHIYNHDSGGDPARIPDLKYDDFVAFHERYYRPSRARFFFFGDDPEEERLHLIESTLADLAEAHPSRCNPLPKVDVPYRPLGTPGDRLVVPYPSSEANVGAGAPAEGDHYVMRGWVINDEPLSTEDSIALGITNDLLVGNTSSSLYRDLMDSKLGTAFIGGGLSDELKQATFSVGLKGVLPENTSKVEAVVDASLQRVVEEGFPPEAIAASVNSTEFSLKEFNTGGIPRGLALMLAVNPSWLYHGDPFGQLDFKRAMRSIRSRLDAGEPIFTNMVKKYLCENACSGYVELKPDADLEARMADDERKQLDAARDRMSQDELQEIIETQKELLDHQGSPDPPHIVEMIPRLELADLEPLISVVPRVVNATGVSKVDGGGHGATTLLTHELAETNGIVYVNVALDLGSMDLSSLAWLPLFTGALTQAGTDTMDEAALTFKIGTDTGGIGATVMFSPVRDSKDPAAWSPSELTTRLVISGKSTNEKIGKLFELLGDVLVGVNISNRERLTEMVHRRREDAHSYLLSSGHSVAGTRLGSKLSKVGWLSEQMGGIAAYDTVGKIDINSDSGWSTCSAHLRHIHEKSVTRENIVVNLTTDGAGLVSAEPHVAQLVDRLPSSLSSDPGTPTSLTTLRNFEWVAADADGAGKNEAFVVPSQVNYVAQGGQLDGLKEASLGAWSVVSRYLRNTWLWDEVRVVGGAYGGFCSLDLTTGTFQYGSYRDPNLQTTLDAYAKSAKFLREARIDGNEVTKGIIGTISDADTPRTPAARGHADMVHYLVGEQSENRQAWRDQVMATTESDFMAFAEVLDAMHASGKERGGDAVVVGGQTAVDEMMVRSQEMKDVWGVRNVI
jgi:Zn-dependent M16 (insulinase) family peptidase